MYDYEDIAFFIDPEDTMTFYEVQRKANTSAVDGEAGEGRKKSDVASYIYNEVAKKTNNRDAALNAYLGDFNSFLDMWKMHSILLNAENGFTLLLLFFKES